MNSSGKEETVSRKIFFIIVLIGIIALGYISLTPNSIVYQFPILRKLFICISVALLIALIANILLGSFEFTASIPKYFVNLFGLDADKENSFKLGGAMGIFVISAIVLFFALDKKIEPEYNSMLEQKSQNCEKTIRIAIIQSGEVDYVRVIRASFINAISKYLGNEKICYDLIERIGTSKGFKEEGSSADYKLLISNLEQREIKIDYYVTIGTVASEAVKRYFRDEKKDFSKKILFLGVTDPIRSDLVGSLLQRNELNSNICGVQYSGNPIIIPQLMRYLYPGKEIVYVFNNNYPQDHYIKNTFEQNSYYKQGAFKIEELDYDPSVQSFNVNKAYFSWYTIEKLIEEKYDSIKDYSNIISTTASHPYYQMIPFAISTNDIEIGKAGADMLMKVIKGNQEMGVIPVYTPDWRLYYSKSKLLRFGFSLPDTSHLKIRTVEYE